MKRKGRRGKGEEGKGKGKGDWGRGYSPPPHSWKPILGSP